MSVHGEKATGKICMRRYTRYLDVKRFPVTTFFEISVSLRKYLKSAGNAGYRAKVGLTIRSYYGDMFHAGKSK